MSIAKVMGKVFQTATKQKGVQKGLQNAGMRRVTVLKGGEAPFDTKFFDELNKYMARPDAEVITLNSHSPIKGILSKVKSLFKEKALPTVHKPAEADIKAVLAKSDVVESPHAVNLQGNKYHFSWPITTSTNKPKKFTNKIRITI